MGDSLLEVCVGPRGRYRQPLVLEGEASLKRGQTPLYGGHAAEGRPGGEAEALQGPPRHTPQAGPLTPSLPPAPPQPRPPPIPRMPTTLPQCWPGPSPGASLTQTRTPQRGVGPCPAASPRPHPFSPVSWRPPHTYTPEPALPQGCLVTWPQEQAEGRTHLVQEQGPEQPALRSPCHPEDGNRPGFSARPQGLGDWPGDAHSGSSSPSGTALA